MLSCIGRSLLYTVQGNPLWKAIVAQSIKEAVQNQARLSGMEREVTPSVGYNFAARTFISRPNANQLAGIPIELKRERLAQIVSLERLNLVNRLLVALKEASLIREEDYIEVHAHLLQKAIKVNRLKRDQFSILTTSLLHHLEKIAAGTLKSQQEKGNRYILKQEIEKMRTAINLPLLQTQISERLFLGFSKLLQYDFKELTTLLRDFEDEEQIINDLHEISGSKEFESYAELKKFFGLWGDFLHTVSILNGAETPSPRLCNAFLIAGGKSPRN